MKNIVFISFFCLSQAFFAQDWCADYPSALMQSKAENKPLVLVFSGSDWCAPCIKLEHEIWTSEKFKAHAAQNYVLYRANFPKKKKNQLPQNLRIQNERLAEKFNPKGYFPLVLVLDGNENTMGSTGYKNLSPNAYIELLDSFLK